MCGINGLISIQQEEQSKLDDYITRMNDMIIHRGPDDDGAFTYSDKEGAIAMGMRRLSIIDLNSGKQPIYSEDKNIVIVFNGEIYNYRTLRNELETLGATFTTQSDTEVILKLYENQGTSSFHKLDGMFGFSIYDKKKNKVFIARDFFGEKPLYYTEKEGKFIWASELKSVLKIIDTVPSIDKKGLNLFFKLTYIPAPFTIYEGIHKLESNHFITYDLSTHTHSIECIEEITQAKKENVSFEDAKSSVKELVNESVVSRSVSDVPIGTFLSGGVDSSIVSLCLAKMNHAKINTFSIGFAKKSYDETDKARTVSKLINSHHHEFILDEKDLESNIDKILLNFDEPFADSSSLPTYLVANKTSEHVKVALTGDGGDEVFGGYNKYHMGNINKKYTSMVPRGIHNLIKKTNDLLIKPKHDKRGMRYRVDKLLNAIDYSDNYYWDIISLGYAGDSLSSYLLPEMIEANPFAFYQDTTGIRSPKDLTEYRTIDKHMSLEGDMLVKVDRTSMLSSIECRAPFLNKKIWKYTNTLPDDYLMKGWNKKYILKEAFREEFPKDFLDKSKSGFGVPVGDWLRSALRQDLENCISDTLLDTQNIFQKDTIKKLVTDHLNGKDNTFKVWTFYCFQKWYIHSYVASENEILLKK
ncbi:asparagine synthase (glutamine-hydrolyzing) [Aquimarina aquimarini]|uniref:asparagine synthase (glutamine-hydrolyzing) n=1 Tax=Aquimarina aquimarini TaxID=1191734 RepID=UPI000D558589|nr:asparagine synthase (glutamine-hydrolyzing) [Aquimarina aquimarini]